MSFPNWYQNAVFYEVYVRAFCDSNGDGHGDLRGLAAKLDYLKDLGADCIWLLPIYSSPLKDDGYDISDYYNVHPDYGTLDDFARLLKEAHDRRMRIIMDLVINHTSDQHPWFQASRSVRESPFRDYYVWSDTDQKYANARVIFVDTEKSNWTWDPVANQYYWHRFYSCQPDLNYDNPQVQDEIFNAMKFWLDMGVDGFRVDAVPYLFEREGTNCENLPETHSFLKKLRRFVDEDYPGRILLCEANQRPKVVQHYFGDGDEFHLAFHFPLMPRIFMSLRQGDRSPIQWALEQTPAIPSGCQWCTFLRNHDELTLEMVSPEERRWMWQEYAPDPRMKLNLGIRRRLAPLLDNDHRKIELANAIMFALPGTPVIYYGDEIGMGDNIELPDRSGVRTPMQWEAGPSAGFSSAPKTYSPIISTPPYSPNEVNVSAQQADSESLWHALQRMIRVRKQHPAFGLGDFNWLDMEAKTILAFSRRYKDETILSINNLSDQPTEIALPLKKPTQNLTNALTEQAFPLQNGHLKLTLPPYGYSWLIQ